MVLNGLEESLASTKSSIAKIASDITETRNSVSDKIIKNTNCLEVRLKTVDKNPRKKIYSGQS